MVNQMRLRHYACVAALLVTATALRAAPFQNLNFNTGTIHAAPANYVPWDAVSPIDAVAALPGWTAMEDTSIATALWGQNAALDETFITLIRTNAIEGGRDIQLYSYIDAPSGYFHTASISQTGDIPAVTNSIFFYIRTPAVGVGINPIPYVTLNGIPIVTFPVSNVGGIVEMQGDVTQFAGTTAHLTFEAAGISGSFPASEDIFELDNISFSPQPVPEPATLMLAAPAVFLLRTRRDGRATQA